KPTLDTIDTELSLTHLLALPDGQVRPLAECRFFVGQPVLVLVENEFFILRNAPPASLLGPWPQRLVLPVKNLSHRLLTELRKSQTSRPQPGQTSGGNGNVGKTEPPAAAEADWTQLCITHSAKPRFVL